MTAITVDHTRDHDLMLDGDQAARAWALWHLTGGGEHRLPRLKWLVSDDESCLLAWVNRVGHYDRARADIEAWAAFLHVEPVTAKVLTLNGREQISAEGRAYGARVRVWAWTSDIPETPGGAR